MIKIGDKVAVIDEDLAGEVKHIDDGLLTIETEEGFLLKFTENAVIKVENHEALHVSRSEIAKALKDKKEGQKRKHSSSYKRITREPLIVDLHIQELTPSTKNMSNYEMLVLQLDTVERRLNFAIENHIQRLILIHGVGKGVLRMEVETLLKGYDQVEFSDADFQKYGRGATEVYIYQNY